MKKLLLLSALFFISSSIAAPFAYITNGEGGDVVTVVDLATNTLIATIPVGSLPSGVVITPDGTKAYVTNQGDATVSVINTATNTVIATIAVGGSPSDIAVTHDGTTVYVANGAAGTVTPIDVATDTAGAPIVFVGGANGITISPDDRTAYVSNGAADTVTPVDLTTGTLGTPIAVGEVPLTLAITPNGRKVYVANTDAPLSISVIDTATNTVVATIPVAGESEDIAISFDSRLVYVSLSNNQVIIISTSTDTIINTVGPISDQDISGLAFFPCGQTLYIASTTGTLIPLNVATNTLGMPFPAGPSPFNLAITPIIQVQGKLIKNVFLNRIELVAQLCWNICPFTLASFFRIFQDGVVVGQVFPTGLPSKFAVCLSPNFVCNSCSSGCSSSSDRSFNVELGLFAASGVEIARIPVV